VECYSSVGSLKKFYEAEIFKEEVVLFFEKTPKKNENPFFMDDIQGVKKYPFGIARAIPISKCDKKNFLVSHF